MSEKDKSVEDIEKEQEKQEKPVQSQGEGEEETEQEDGSAPKKKSKSEILTVKEIDELYEDIKKAAEGGHDEKEKKLVKQAVEAERKRQAQREQERKDQEEKAQLKSEVAELKEAMQAMREQSSGRRSQVPQEKPFQRSEDGKVKIPKQEFDQAARQFMSGK